MQYSCAWRSASETCPGVCQLYVRSSFPEVDHDAQLHATIPDEVAPRPVRRGSAFGGGRYLWKWGGGEWGPMR